MELKLEFGFNPTTSQIQLLTLISADNSDPTQYHYLERVREYISPRISRMPKNISHKIIVEPPKKGIELSSGIIVFKKHPNNKIRDIEDILVNITINKTQNGLQIINNFHATPLMRIDYDKFIRRIGYFHEKCYDINLIATRKFIYQEEQVRNMFEENYLKRKKVINTIGFDILGYILSGLKQEK